MLPRFHVKDFLTVGHYLGSLLLLLGALMLVPLLVALAFDEIACAVSFLFGMGVCTFVGSVLHLIKPSRLDRRRSLLLCGFGWVILALVAAIPMYYTGGFETFLDAFFDSVSALTSTGATLCSDVESMAYSQITWRIMLSLAGAQAIIIVALYLGFFGDGGYSARENAKARHDSTANSLDHTARFIVPVTALFVLIGAIIVCVFCMQEGMPFADAVMNGFWLAAGAFSTGSFVPHASSLIYYHSAAINGVLAVFMLLGSLNFVLFLLIVKRGAITVSKNSELRAMAVWTVLLVVIVSVLLCRDNVYTTLSGLFNHGTFMVIASVTTCGMQTIYPDQLGKSFSDGAFILLMAAMFIGASSCSSAGGLKIFRALQLLRWFGYTIMRTLLPDAVQYNIVYQHFGPKRMVPGDAMLAMCITILYITAAMLGAIAYIAYGYDALESIGESISYVTNSGLTTGITGADMPLPLKIVAMAQMWLGRLEFIILIAAFAGLVISVLPHRNRMPEGVVNTRKSQRSERIRKRLREPLGRRKHSSKPNPKDGESARPSNGKSGTASASFVLTCLMLAVLLVATPLASVTMQAYADEGGAEVSAEDLPDIDLEVGYRKVSVSELLDASSRMDGENVVVKGEAVGQPLKADKSHVWVSIRSNESVISILMTNRQAEKIGIYGGYCSTGDTIKVQGKYHVACSSHEGELEVHAANVTSVKVGSSWTIHYSSRQLQAGIVLLLGGIVILVAQLIAGGRPRKLKSLI